MVEQGLEQECGHFGHSDAHGQWDTRHSMESATFNSRLTSTQSGRSSAYTYFFHRNRPPCMRSQQRACCSIWTAHCLVGPVCMTVLMLVDSTPAVEATWRDFSERHGLDLTMVLQSEQIHRRRVDWSWWETATHGVRTIDNLRRLSGLTDEGELKVSVDLSFLSAGLTVARGRRIRTQNCIWSSRAESSRQRRSHFAPWSGRASKNGLSCRFAWGF